jgi:hypothetical protein
MNKEYEYVDEHTLKENMTRFLGDLLVEHEKQSRKNYFRFLIRQWLILIGCVCAVFLVGFIVIEYLYSQNLILTSSITLDTAKVLVGPCITINGLLITLMPVIAFFCVREVEESQKINDDRLKDKEGKRDPGIGLIVTQIRVYMRQTSHNTKVGVLKYVRVHIIVSLISLLILILGYVGLTSTNPLYFIGIDFILLSLLVSGVLPIISVALSETFISEKSLDV